MSKSTKVKDLRVGSLCKLDDGVVYEKISDSGLFKSSDFSREAIEQYVTPEKEVEHMPMKLMAMVEGRTLEMEHLTGYIYLVRDVLVPSNWSESTINLEPDLPEMSYADYELDISTMQGKKGYKDEDDDYDSTSIVEIKVIQEIY